MLFANYICLITMIGSTNNKFVCIKLFEMKCGNYGIANVFESNIPSQKKQSGMKWQTLYNMFVVGLS